MPKRSNCKNRSDNKPFFQMYKEMTKSQIFRKLSGNALKVLIDLMSQYNGNNNGMLIMPFNKSAELGISQPTLNKALNELETKGFIKKSVQGGRNTLSHYSVTCFPVDDCLNQYGLKQHTLPVSNQASNDWRIHNKTLVNTKDKQCCYTTKC